MSTTSNTPAAPARDERVKQTSRFRQAFIRPELGAASGTIIVLIFFLLTASDKGMFSSSGVLSWSVVAAQFAIIATGACLLMIAGEFDLSVGSMIGFVGVLVALLTVEAQWPAWAAILVAMATAVMLGAVNGWLVIKTGLPSFIVTLAFLYILRGMAIFIPTATTGKTIIGGLREATEGDWLTPLFGGKILTDLFSWLGSNGFIEVYERGRRAGQPIVDGIPMIMIWALVLIVFAHILLTRTRFGNWIYASGGNAQAARYVGVPVNRVKILMFMFTALCASIFAICQIFDQGIGGSAASDRGLLKEFEAIICVVIGGALLTGGYGSVIGAALGALIFGMAQQGLGFINIDNSLFRVFLGTLLLLAVILNTYIRRMITGER